MSRENNLEAVIVGKYAAIPAVLDERSRRLWAAAESIAIGRGGDTRVLSAIGMARQTIGNGRREIAQGDMASGRGRRAGTRGCGPSRHRTDAARGQGSAGAAG